MTEQADADEFYAGVWWVPDGSPLGSLRSATLSECAAEIIRLREALVLAQPEIARNAGTLTARETPDDPCRARAAVGGSPTQVTTP